MRGSALNGRRHGCVDYRQTLLEAANETGSKIIKQKLSTDKNFKNTPHLEKNAYLPLERESTKKP